MAYDDHDPGGMAVDMINGRNLHMIYRDLLPNRFLMGPKIGLMWPLPSPFLPLTFQSANKYVLGRALIACAATS